MTKNQPQKLTMTKNQPQSEILEKKPVESFDEEEEVSYEEEDEKSADSGSESESESDEDGSDEASGESKQQMSDKKLKRPMIEVLASPTVKKTKLAGGSMDVTKSAEKIITKKNYFERKWSEDDEIVLLQGMIKFKNDTGKSPSDDLSGFFQTVESRISLEVRSMDQVKSKMRTLKRKYVSKRNKGADEKSFSNDHDRKCFLLSNDIWVSVKVEKSLKTEDGTVSRDWFVNSFLPKSIVRFGMEEHDLKQQWNMVSLEEKMRLEEKLRLQQAIDFKSVFGRSALVHEVLSVMAKASK